MKILANENIPKRSVEILRDHGFDIKSVGTDNPSISDKDVIKLAQNEERIIITFDSDYGDLIFKQGYKSDWGVIYFRLSTIDIKEFAQTVIQILSDKSVSFENKLTVFDGKKIRQRKY